MKYFHGLIAILFKNRSFIGGYTIRDNEYWNRTNR